MSDPTLQNTVIVYVEDDPRSRKVMNLLLRGSLGLQHVTILEDSRNFMAQIEALDPPPQVVFLDIHVAPLDGFAMLSLLQAHPRFQKVPVVALTASVMNEEVGQLRVAGFHGCIAKPIDTDIFPEILKRILNGEAIWNITS
jgi:CheY-like chemotaxis protein